jgi:hypothetical protein
MRQPVRTALLALAIAALAAGCSEDAEDPQPSRVFQSRQFVDTTVKIRAGGFHSWTLNTLGFDTLSVVVSSTDDVDSFLIPDAEFDTFEKRASFDPVAGTTLINVVEGSYTSPRLPAGRFHLVVSNRSALLFSRTVTITATLDLAF